MTALHRFGQEGWYGVAARLATAQHRPAPIRVLIVDDHFLFAEMLAMALEIEERFEVVGHAHDGGEAVELAAWLRPDVVLMDISMPVLDGIAATPRVLAASPGSKVVIISSSDSADDRERARGAGAVAYLTKEASTDDLLRAVERVVSAVIPLRPGPGSPPPADQPAVY
jgi:DNA-binding NarL/FixJ family response regulator